jgi:hypothetical protein
MNLIVIFIRINNNLNIKKFYSILLLTAGFFSLSHAQTTTLTGKVTDSLNNPLGYANILAIPEADKVSVSFVITKEKRLKFKNL